MSSTHLGDAANDYPDAIEGDEAAIAAFFPADDKDAPKKKPSEKGNDEPKEEEEQAEADDEEADDKSDESPDEDSDDEEGEDDEDGKETKDKKYADDSDETYVKIKVGEETHEVKVNDLKRLFGQEASLTRNSQEVAEQRKQVEQNTAKNIAAYDVMLKRVSERAQQYRDLPWTQLMKDPNVPADQLQALQAEAQKAFEDEGFIKSELDGFMSKVQETQKAERAKSAQVCIKSLTTEDSPHHIKGWSEAVYNDLRTFGTEMGLDKEMVNGLTDPGAFKILHMAMQFKRGSKGVVVTKKVNKTPTKIVKNSAATPTARGTKATADAKAAVKQAKTSGSRQDAENAFLALMGD